LAMSKNEIKANNAELTGRRGLERSGSPLRSG